MEIGVRIRLRAFGGHELVRRLVGRSGDVVHVCKEEEFQAAQREGRTAVVVGFSSNAVIEVLDE